MAISSIKRPPVVCILGHVDHGKTTLLDFLRKSSIAAGESGGITQHIGAYQVKIKNQKGEFLRNAKIKNEPEEVITFIDTPGHAAFSKLRSRGVAATDIAVLVIDGVEGVKAQTVESLAHIKQANIPFIVAINKMDLPGFSPDMVKAQLSEKGVLVEGYGGDVVSIPISAKTGKGVGELLELIILLSQMQDLKADPQAPPEGLVIEAKLDPRRGPVATILVENGTFKLGGLMIAGKTQGKIKAIFNENGKKLNSAGPSQPVQILGFNQTPLIGSPVTAILPGKKAKNIEAGSEAKAVVAKNEGEESKKLKIILKADVSGSLEAIKDSLPEEIELVSCGIGEINESDILLAVSTHALLLAYRVSIPNQVAKLAEFEGITVKSYDIIYKLLEDLEKKALKLIEPEIDEEILGEARIIAEFKIKGNHIAGAKIVKGIISRNNLVHIKRENKLIADTKIKFLQRNRLNIESGKTGDEIGMVFYPDVDFSIGDVIISYKKIILS